MLDQITTEELTKPTGLAKLITILQKLLGKDDLEDSIIKYDDFEDFSRSGGSIEDYIHTFDSKYTKIKNKGITLPAEVLAFKLLRKSNITSSERKIVLTGMDYSNKTTLYDQAKKSLKKFCGVSASGSTSSEGFSVPIKQETFINFGRGRGRGQQNFWPHQRSMPNASSTNWRGAGRSFSSNGWRGVAPGGTRGRGDHLSKSAGERPMNPLGLDGKPLLCRGCGSCRHFINACPES